MLESPGVGIGIIVLIVIAVLATIIGIWTNRYKVVGPSEVMVVSGRSRKIGDETRGFRVVRNGGTFVLPFLEIAQIMSLRVISAEVGTRDTPSIDGVPITVRGTALFKVASTDEGISSAAERYMDAEGDIKPNVTKVLDGHLRGVVGKLTPEEIYRERQAFQEQIAEQAQTELAQSGILLDSLTLNEIDDEQGYFRALGEKRIAEVKRDARIATAESERDAAIKEAEARRTSESAQAEADTIVAEAYKNRDVEKAVYDAERLREEARRDQSQAESEAEAKRKVELAQAELAKAAAERRQEQLVEEIIKPAEAQKKADIIRAEGDRESREIRAAAVRKELEEQAAAEVYSIRETGNAEAEAIKAKAVAEAEGLEKRAEALEKFKDASIRFELSRAVIDILPQTVEASTKHFSNIKEFRVLDFGGGGNGNGSGGLRGLLELSPAAIAKADESLKATTGLSLVDLVGLVRTGSVPNQTEPNQTEPNQTD